ncbi:MAG: adenosylcobinamide-GDP ribazoletransferase, partial [Megasphaera sp.]|nr:adenosylcobinamide-GDP ribazoletransferase [Megasphaera sp.]
KVTFLSQLEPKAAMLSLVAVPAAVRFGTLISIFQFPYARKEGLGKAFVTYAPPHTTAKALVLALLPVFLCGPFYLAFLGAAMILSLWANLGISRKLGGVTGDTYGAVIEGSEMVLLLLVVIGSKAVHFLL